jgi:hypothetical protein
MVRRGDQGGALLLSNVSRPGNRRIRAPNQQRAIGADMAIERLPGDAQFPAQVGDLGFRLSHGRHGEAHLRRGHLEGLPTRSATDAGGGEASPGPFGDQLAFELGRAAKMPNTSLPDAVVVSMVAP